MEVVTQQQPQKHKLRHAMGKTKNFFKALFSKKARKIALMTGLLALLVVTGYLNFSLNQNAVNINAGSKTETNMFITLKENRTDARLARQLLLEDIIANGGSSAEARAQAEAELETLASEIAFETNAENLIAAQCGYEDVIVSRNGQKINVIVKSAEEINEENMQKMMKVLASAMGKTRLEPEKGDAVFVSIM